MMILLMASTQDIMSVVDAEECRRRTCCIYVNDGAWVD